MKLSIVTTLYQSAPYLDEFHRRISDEARKITEDFELIFVNDGSPDDALEKAVALLEKDKRVRIIDLSRNFGHHKAMMTGLSHARGDFVFLIDCDLEEDPELLGIFHEKMQAAGTDVVYGVQSSRKGDFFERISGWMFWRLFNALSHQPLVPNQLVARLMTRQYVASLVEYRDREPFMDGLWALTGFHQIPVSVSKHSKGSTTYSLRRKVSLAANALTSFSSFPLVVGFYIGVVIMALALIAAASVVVLKWLDPTIQAGWPSLIVSVWFLGGLTIFCLGIVGIYISRIFMEVKSRPYTVVKKIHERL